VAGEVKEEEATSAMQLAHRDILTPGGTIDNQYCRGNRSEIVAVCVWREKMRQCCGYISAMKLTRKQPIVCISASPSSNHHRNIFIVINK